jgi:putative transposase
MARLPRNVVPGQALHVIQRGNNRQAVFFSQADFRYYHESLREAAHKYSCEVHAYVFMTNHVHLLLTPHMEAGPSRMMQSVGRRYVRYVNIVYQRTGTLWEGRFKSAIIDSDQYLLTCSRYIELNPVRAGMVASPAHYRWSSYHHNALGRRDELIVPHRLYSEFHRDEGCRCRHYKSLFNGCFDQNVLTELRAGTQTGSVIGNERFREQIQEALKRRVDKYTHGGDRKSSSFRSREKGSSTLTP